MAFSFKSKEFEEVINQLKKISSENMMSADLELKKWSQLIRSIQFIFNPESLDLLEENAIETRKLNLFNLVSSYEANKDNPAEFLKVCVINCCIYMKEAYFRLGSGEDTLVRKIFEEVSELKRDEYSKYKTYFDYLDELPYRICREIYTNSKLNEIRKFLDEKDFSDYKKLIKESEKASDLIVGWQSTFDVKVDEVKRLEQKLESYKTTYDFVLLNKGFQQLYDQKKEELKERRDGYSQFGATLVCTPIAVIVGVIILILTGQESTLPSLWFLVLPITTLMILLFYFTRVGLQHVRSVQSQMMQLELRMALCQFIHNYADDSEKLHAKNKAGFEKFENIIFSPLVSSDDKIPTTFDGMEQLAKLVSEFRK